MKKIQEILEKNKQKYLDELIELLKIPSVSADSAYKNEVAKTAEFVKEKMIAAGLENVEICPTPGHPIVYGEKILDASKPTVLVYGHYDVQPADPLDLWNSPPFEPVIKDGKIYARGACDDKGQMYMHIKALELLLSNHQLNCNVKVMIEGEEEIGSVNLGRVRESQ
jgi:acetylornithine deacetylase/succinyl-diaminopimelate desuccinylase-like protein